MQLLVLMVLASWSFCSAFKYSMLARYQSSVHRFVNQRGNFCRRFPTLLTSTASHQHHAGCNHGDHDDTVVTRCTRNITNLLSPLKVHVSSSNDDPNGSHIRVEVVSSLFEGKNVVQRQRMVYKALWEELNGPVHAVDSIIAKTPKEAAL